MLYGVEDEVDLIRATRVVTTFGAMPKIEAAGPTAGSAGERLIEEARMARAPHHGVAAPPRPPGWRRPPR
jgi:hypothetical protein